MINRVLTDVRIALSNEPTMAYLDLLDDETLPSNSDVVLILGQYPTAAQQFKTDYHKHDPSRAGPSPALVKGLGVIESDGRSGAPTRSAPRPCSGSVDHGRSSRPLATVPPLSAYRWTATAIPGRSAPKSTRDQRGRKSVGWPGVAVGPVVSSIVP